MGLWWGYKGYSKKHCRVDWPISGSLLQHSLISWSVNTLKCIYQLEYLDCIVLFYCLSCKHQDGECCEHFPEFCNPASKECKTAVQSFGFCYFLIRISFRAHTNDSLCDVCPSIVV